MSVINDARRAALNTGEAALLPALPRIRGAGTAALQSALRAAAAMEEMQLSNAVDTSLPLEAGRQQECGECSTQAGCGRIYREAGSRAALHHILKR